MISFTNSRNIEEYLYRYQNNEISFKRNFYENRLKSINSLFVECRKILFNNKMQDEYPIKIIHVAGSKGKSSVCFIISHILTRDNYRTGLFISPHLLHFSERIRIDENDVDIEIYEKIINIIDGVINSNNKAKYSKTQFYKPTYFEILTVLALLIFEYLKCDIAVMETGLGGRYDATNIIKPVLSIITNISLEHTKILGDTLEKIAYEKAGIIKTNVPVLSAKQEENVEKIIEKKAFEQGSDIYFLDRDIEYSGTRQGITYNFTIKDKVNNNIIVGLSVFSQPLYQLENIVLGITAIRLLREKNILDTSDLRIRRAVQEINIPGRFEIIEKDAYSIVLDGAHNPYSMRKLFDSINEFFIKKRIITIFSAFNDKNIKEMASIVEKYSESIFTVPIIHYRGLSGKDIAKNFKQSKKLHISETLRIALNQAENIIRKSTEQDFIILITGSLYLVSEMKKKYIF